MQWYGNFNETGSVGDLSSKTAVSKANVDHGRQLSYTK